MSPMNLPQPPHGPSAGRRGASSAGCCCRQTLTRQEPGQPEQSPRSHAAQLAAVIFGWGRWDGPSVRVDPLDGDDPPPRR